MRNRNLIIIMLIIMDIFIITVNYFYKEKLENQRKLIENQKKFSNYIQDKYIHENTFSNNSQVEFLFDKTIGSFNKRKTVIFISEGQCWTCIENLIYLLKECNIINPVLYLDNENFAIINLWKNAINDEIKFVEGNLLKSLKEPLILSVDNGDYKYIFHDAAQPNLSKYYLISLSKSGSQ